MKKLDSAYKVWAIAHILGAGLWYIIPLFFDVGLIAIVQYFSIIVVALLAVTIYGTLLAASSNQAANYNNIEEGLKDTNQDVRTFGVLLVLTTTLIVAPMSIFGVLSYLQIPIVNWNEVVGPYSISVVFHIVLTTLRNYERRLTVRNLAERFYEMNPARIVPGA